ncbi:putative transcription factor bZIP family [Helianthus debilis subsp. tardiflorus]
MVVPDAEIMSPGEVESPLQADQHQDGNNIQLGRQSSIYSLTLDEFQHTSGKNFGSMNMDEFLNSIWTAEENQAQAQAHFHPSATGNGGGGGGGGGSGQFMMGINTSSVESNMIARQQSLSRQGSLTLPGSLSRKTVDEVWSEIRKAPGSGSGSAQRQPTYGEMTLEDFLVNAGVVREQNQPNVVQVQPVAIAPFGLYPNGSNRVVGPPHGQAHMVTPVMAPPARFPGKRAGPCQQPPPPCYPSMVGNGGGGYGQGLGTGSPASPVSSDGIATSQLESGNQYEMDMGAIRNGRGRIIDGQVERRQRRMIKNRESAARSRARKQAYTVELEAELNMLKEENAQLKQTLVRTK